MSECLTDVRYATQIGRIRPTHLQTFVLMSIGIDVLHDMRVTPTRPAEEWQAWVHR